MKLSVATVNKSFQLSPIHSPSPPFIKEGGGAMMRFFRNGCNGGDGKL